MDIAKFVQNIKFYCDRKGVKPTNACRDCGVGQSFISNMEGRGSIPSVEKVQLLAQYLGVTVSDLLGETSQGPPVLHDVAGRGRASDMERLTVAEIDLIRAYRRASPKERRLVDLTLEEYKKDATAQTG